MCDIQSSPLHYIALYTAAYTSVSARTFNLYAYRVHSHPHTDSKPIFKVKPGSVQSSCLRPMTQGTNLNDDVA